MSDIRDIIRIVEAASSSSFILDPALDPRDYDITNSLRDVRNWRVKTFLNNNGADTKIGSMDPVGYVMISLTSNRIIPISTNDEHRQGYDLLYYLRDKKKKKINIEDYRPVFFTGFVQIYNESEIKEKLNVLAKFLSYGGKNGILHGYYDMRGKAMTLQQFVASKGNMKVKPGKLAPIGQDIIDQFKAVSEATNAALPKTQTGAERIVPKSALPTAGRAALKAIQYLENLDRMIWPYFKKDDLENYKKMVKQFVADGDAQGLQDMFFGFHSIKNKMHVKLKKMADPTDFDHDRAVGTWGDINLAIDILGTLF